MRANILNGNEIEEFKLFNFGTSFLSFLWSSSVSFISILFLHSTSFPSSIWMAVCYSWGRRVQVGVTEYESYDVFNEQRGMNKRDEEEKEKREMLKVEKKRTKGRWRWMDGRRGNDLNLESFYPQSPLDTNDPRSEWRFRWSKKNHAEEEWWRSWKKRKEKRNNGTVSKHQSLADTLTHSLFPFLISFFIVSAQIIREERKKWGSR